eukprot:GHVS01078450.1.p1 GENE.GHVS01078450.1~~GHVS01078450.1.p1  ORF type:complete len:548 (-),score=119.56 GHVS01078450.1:126-1769(-)
MSRGVLGEELCWSAGFVPLKRLRGSAAHGESWKLKNDIEEQSKALEEKKTQLISAVQKLQASLCELTAGLAPTAATGTEDDPNYLDDYERSAHMDVDDTGDPEAVVEMRQGLKTDLEEQLEDVEATLGELELSQLEFEWVKREPPLELHRLDQPWLEFGRDKVEEAKKIEEQKQKEERQKKEGKKKKKETKDEEADTKVDQLFVAKLHDAGAVSTGDGARRIIFSDAPRDKAGIRSLLVESQQLMKYMWRYILTHRSAAASGGGGSGGDSGSGDERDFEKLSLLPIISIAEVRRTRAGFRDTWNAAIISPFMEHGTAVDAVRRFGGRRSTHFFKDDILMYNLDNIIQCMVYLEGYKVYHGNIKPSNLFISSDGFNMCLGDFCPPSELKRWFLDMASNLANIPEYISPEYFHNLAERKEKNYVWISKYLDPYKNDVFCMGLCMHYLLTMEAPANFQRTEHKVAERIEKLRKQGRSEELVATVESMLTYSAASRPRWKDLLAASKRRWLFMDNVVKGLRTVVGIKNEDAESEEKILQQNVHAEMLRPRQ